VFRVVGIKKIKEGVWWMSEGNLSSPATSKVCQNCAKCCLEWWWIEYSRDFPQRAKMLNHPDIVVEEKRLHGNLVWLIRIKHPCSMLGKDKHEKYFCKAHRGDRPNFCRTFPDNTPFELYEIEKDLCPAISNFLGKGELLKANQHKIGMLKQALETREAELKHLRVSGG